MTLLFNNFALALSLHLCCVTLDTVRKVHYLISSQSHKIRPHPQLAVKLYFNPSFSPFSPLLSFCFALSLSLSSLAHKLPFSRFLSPSSFLLLKNFMISCDIFPMLFSSDSLFNFNFCDLIYAKLSLLFSSTYFLSYACNHICSKHDAIAAPRSIIIRRCEALEFSGLSLLAC